MSNFQETKTWRRILILLFVYSAGLVLVVTATAKLASARGTAQLDAWTLELSP